MNINYDAIRAWVDIVQIAGTVLIGIYVWITGRQRVTDQNLKTFKTKINSRLDGHGDRITRIESDVNHMPTHHDMAALSGRIEALHGDVHELVGTMTGLRRAVDLMNEHLLNNRNKG